ncbi:hypothetical protein [Herbaspirillum sp. YR522]|uniref:hypothetical protein n=1 Tax=Herbaspirillum sp. YR522 TaxID=1144342 RepID=UPI00026F6E5D|nr:hypothetical protein [Herbaspirillum sp. YR522]EJM96978.1 hypothetical protein PMI40_04506 [Herbaspirillum sp. YR522]
MTTAYIVANGVPLAALPTTNGVKQQFFADKTNDGPSTFAPDGLAAAPIVGLAGHSLQGDEIPSGALVTLTSYISPLLNSGALCWLLTDCAGGTQQITPATHGEHAVTLDQLNGASRSGIRGLLGKANATTPLTKFDFSTASRTFRNPNTGRLVTTYNTSVITADAGLAGPALNGRDQAAAFAAGSWIYLYAVSNGQGVEGAVFSANPPSVGPNAISGYPYSVFITALYWTNQSAIRRAVAAGDTVCEAEQYSVGSWGNTAGSEVPFSIAAACPPIALRLKARINSYISTNAGGGGTASARYRFISGIDAKEIPLGQPVANATAYDNEEVEFPNINQQLFIIFLLTSGPGNISSILSTLKSIGYVVPNGDN